MDYSNNQSGTVIISWKTLVHDLITNISKIQTLLWFVEDNFIAIISLANLEGSMFVKFKISLERKTKLNVIFNDMKCEWRYFKIVIRELCY